MITFRRLLFRLYLASLACNCLCARAVGADPRVHLHLILPGAWSDIAIAREQVLLGQISDDELGHAAGAGFLVDFSTGEIQRKLLAADGQALDVLGRRVALNGTHAVLTRTGNQRHGAVYVFDASTGSQIYEIHGDEAHEPSPFGFGRSVASDGRFLVVGDLLVEREDGAVTGGAFIFDAATGDLLHELVPQDGADGDWYSMSVAAHGGRILVGSEHHTGLDPPLYGSGAGYLYDAATGDLLHQLRPDLANTDAGWSVALNDRFAVLTSPSAFRELPMGPSSGSGSAAVFDLQSGELVRRLMPDVDVENDFFGDAVDMDSRYVVIGAPEADTGTPGPRGSVYVFDLESGRQIEKLRQSSEAPGNFGDIVTIDDGLMVVRGTTRENEQPTFAAYFYEIIDTITGDADRDSDVDSADLSVLVANWTGALDGTEGGKLFRQGNFDLDRDVDAADLNALIVAWTGALAEPRKSEPLIVPEPSGAALAGLALLRLVAVTRRKRRSSQRA